MANKRKLIFPCFLLFTLIYLGLVVSLFAVEIMNPSNQTNDRRVHFETYYRHLSRQDASLTINGNSAVNIKNSTITSANSTDLETEGSARGALMKLSVRPFEPRLQFYAVGGLSSYDLKLASGSGTNTFSTGNNGYTIGGGVHYNLVPNTLVNPSVAVDITAMHSSYRLTQFTDRVGITNETNFLLILFELQAALSVSKKYVFDARQRTMSAEPYAGIKLQRTRLNLDELATGAHYSGTRTGYAPYLGLKFSPTQNIGLIAEGSFLNEYGASVGLTFQY